MAHLVEVKHLKKIFTVKSNTLFTPSKQLYAVDDVDFTIDAGECVGLVGESGCGKSTLARLIMRLLKPTDGEILIDGEDISRCNAKELKEIRKKIQIIFQDPYSSLNPRKTIYEIISAPLKIHGGISSQEELTAKVKQLLDLVGLSTDYLHHYPHEFSGGQRQRIGIARAIALQPKLIICDEPVSALDVSVQAQVINLLQDLKNNMNLSYLFVAHDLSVVKHISDRVLVMYLGKIVESAKKEELFAHPLHPYTKALISAIPSTDPNVKTKRIILSGDVSTPIGEVDGCRFAGRCYKCQEICRTAKPPLYEKDGRQCLCHFPNIDE